MSTPEAPDARLIEHTFPLKATSLCSVHEKSVRHGHLSTLHIWPARRPLAACRAALLATLLPDPGTANERKALCEAIGGVVKEKKDSLKMPDGSAASRLKEHVEGGVLNWLGPPPSSGGAAKRKAYKHLSAEREHQLEDFRQQIRQAYGGRAPRVLDPFAGGGAIPLEAMRLGCEVTAADLNPVAWLLLKCTLDYPQRCAGKTWPLPDFTLSDAEFMQHFYQMHPSLSPADYRAHRTHQGDNEELDFKHQNPHEQAVPEADLAWQLRAWGRRLWREWRADVAPYYPCYADFEPHKDHRDALHQRQVPRMVPLDTNGEPDIGQLNAEFSDEYLAKQSNPRWIAKPTAAYLWARTVSCKKLPSRIAIAQDLLAMQNS